MRDLWDIFMPMDGILEYLVPTDLADSSVIVSYCFKITLVIILE